MVKENGAWKAITWDDAITRLSQTLSQSRATAANTIFLNQHESGAFARFLEGWLAAYGMPAQLSVDFESDSAAIEANRRTYGVAWPALSFQDARLIISFGADFLDSWGAERSAAARLRRGAREARRRAALLVHRTAPVVDRSERR